MPSRIPTRTVAPFDAYALLDDGEEFVSTVVEALSSPRGDGVADIAVVLRADDEDRSRLTLGIKFGPRGGVGDDVDEEFFIAAPDVLRLSRILHRAAARAQRLGLIPPTSGEG